MQSFISKISINDLPLLKDFLETGNYQSTADMLANNNLALTKDIQSIGSLIDMIGTDFNVNAFPMSYKMKDVPALVVGHNASKMISILGALDHSNSVPTKEHVTDIFKNSFSLQKHAKKMLINLYDMAISSKEYFIIYYSMKETKT